MTRRLSILLLGFAPLLASAQEVGDSTLLRPSLSTCAASICFPTRFGSQTARHLRHEAKRAAFSYVRISRFREKPFKIPVTTPNASLKDIYLRFRPKRNTDFRNCGEIKEE
ncbi:hypothetical protein EII14_06950 [Alloprevotella sp. OH1205_COT-284]|uniref:hypothetical protein n=1 Tax=Alloprevotella sp. OH1205_COT-284 TaxID=2491043 RepID=UPI000F5EEC2C|nr:hypothetical protein [Alloprevotella sp. OH1205_COT-284]RRD78266.1 hypothetical protein EII14_06950 [Alloprevotella sp. OH1205_COT-284]